MGRGALLLALAGALALGACAEEQKPAATQAGAGDPERGRQVYLAQCTVCHGSDPARDGPVGPAVKGASRELLEARVVRGMYPPGYAPKRPTAVMQPMPDVAPSIGDLAAYLR